MDIQAEQMGQILVVCIAGSIDALSASRALDFLLAQVDGGQAQIALDLSRVDFMSSSGIRLILEVAKKTRSRSGDLRLTGAQPDIYRTLEISGLIRVLKLYNSVDEAVSSFQT